MSAFWVAILFLLGGNWAEAADRWTMGEELHDVNVLPDHLSVIGEQESLAGVSGKEDQRETHGNVPWEGGDENALSPGENRQTDSVATAMTGDSERAGVATSVQEGPPSPPPDLVVPTIDEHTLLAANTSTDDKASGEGNSAPAPKTTKESSVSTPILVGAGVAIAVGAAVAAGGSSGSDSDSPAATTPTTTSGDTSSGSTEVIHLTDLVRIGDDNDYNSNHPDKFKQSRPSGLSWTDTFNINNVNTVTSAKFKYTVAASKVANPVYINGNLAGKLCNPGNTAWNVEACSVNILGYIHSGSNEINIKCAIDESDTATPYDDVEIYDLRIELTN
jgi:hypothetical protein